MGFGVSTGEGCLGVWGVWGVLFWGKPKVRGLSCGRDLGPTAGSYYHVGRNSLSTDA